MRNFLMILAAVAMMAGQAAAVENWPEFRGPRGNGHAPGSDPPIEWSESENIAWKTPIRGRAWSSPVVWGDQVWLTTASKDGRERYAVCVDRRSGEIIHDIKLFDVADPQYAHPFNSYASPTPIIEGSRVYITFGAAGTACLDRESGELLWQRRDIEVNHFRGAGSSPILFEDLLIMNFDGSDRQFIIALDKNTGETVWRADRSIEFHDLTPEGEPIADGDRRKAFSTPLIVETAAGEPILVSLGAKAGYAYDPRTGEEIWRYEERDNHSAATRPVAGGGLIFCPTGLPRGDLWAIRPGGEGLINDTEHVVWKYERNVPKKPSILLVDGLIYMVDDSGVATCLEADTGEEVWKARERGDYTASPIYAGGRIYFFSEGGKTTVIKPGREFEKLAENRLDAGFMASPAVAGDALFLRTKTHLYRIEKEAK